MSIAMEGGGRSTAFKGRLPPRGGRPDALFSVGAAEVPAVTNHPGTRKRNRPRSLLLFPNR
jgi:hypothetical protein